MNLKTTYKIAIITLIIALVPMISSARSINWKRFEKNSGKYDRIIEKYIKVYSEKYDVDITPELVKAVISYESNWSVKAHNKNSNCIGLMQIKNGSHDPDKNIKCGISMLCKYLKRFDGDKHLALSAYNQGIGRVTHKVKNHNYSGSNYSHSVMLLSVRITSYYACGRML